MIYLQEKDFILRTIESGDGQALVEGFAAQGWVRSIELFDNYLRLQKSGELRVVMAEAGGAAVGFALLLPCSEVGPFAHTGIPEISNFNVLIPYQRRGIGNRILDVVEGLASKSSDSISLSVGLHRGYGPAQRMYVKRGYIPDGSGLWYRDRPLEPGAPCANDDDLQLYFLKRLR